MKEETKDVLPRACKFSSAGNKREKKLAAIMMPAAMPCIPFRRRALHFPDKNTNAAPKAVMKYVKHVASKACTQRGSDIKRSKSVFPPYIPLYHLMRAYGESCREGGAERAALFLTKPISLKNP